MFKCIYNGEKEKAAGKNVFGATIKKMIAEDSKVCYLDADLMNSIGTFGLDKDYPDQIIECGIQEANMIGVAAGMSAAGMKPIAHTFGSFGFHVCRLCEEQCRDHRFRLRYQRCL